jgi:hypothetical protein
MVSTNFTATVLLEGIHYKVRFLTLYSWLRSLFSHVSHFDASSSLLVKNNPESFHCHYNGQFYSSHPFIHVFLEVILDQQATTYIKMRNMAEQAPQPRIEREKTASTHI